MAKSREELIDEMLDREAIRELPVLYCKGAWGDPELQASVFAEDATFTVMSEKPVTMHGREAMLKNFRERQTTATPRPLIHNIAVELKSPTEAVGWCVVELRSQKEGMRLIYVGYYDDEYVKIDGQWKFKSRRHFTFPVS